jgi:hypothetical protein
MWTKVFWMDTGERALKTFAQTLLVFLSAGWTSVAEVPWWQAVSGALLGAVISLLTSIVSSFVQTDGRVRTASLVSTVSRVRRQPETDQG